MKKILLVMLMMISLLIVAGANGKSDQSGSSTAMVKNVNPAGVFPVVKEPWTMTVMFPQKSLIEDMETNKFTKLMEDKTGIKVEWQLIPEKNIQEKVNLVFASGTDLPDVMVGCAAGLGNAAQVQYGSQGLILPLNDYIDEYGTEFNRVLNLPQFATFRSQMTAPDGNIYSLPKISECYQCEYAARLYINQVWLDKLNLKMPTTTDELYQVLKAFKTKDPNGNGKADEIGMVGAITGWRTEIDLQLMNSFIYNDGRNQNRFFLDNGKIKASFTTNEWKEGLLYMNKLAREGLLDPVSFTQDKNQLQQLSGNAEIPLVGVFTGGTIFGAVTPTSENRFDYTVIPPLAGPNGKKGTPYFPTNPQTGKFVITSACENPEAAYRWADWMYADEPSLAMRFGEQGVDYVFSAKGEVDPFGKQAYLKPILEWGTVQNSHWTFDQPGYSTRQAQVSQTTNPGEWNNNNLFIAETPMYEAVAPGLDEVVPPLFFTDEESEEILDLKSTIVGYVEESIARFVTGDLDINSNWDSYLAELKNMGLDRYIEINQKVYERQYK
jgi:putative aldouronate transport system substrate-binding protein